MAKAKAPAEARWITVLLVRRHLHVLSNEFNSPRQAFVI
jgi:hypothetical protein